MEHASPVADNDAGGERGGIQPQVSLLLEPGKGFLSGNGKMLGKELGRRLPVRLERAPILQSERG